MTLRAKCQRRAKSRGKTVRRKAVEERQDILCDTQRVCYGNLLFAVMVIEKCNDFN